MLDVSPARGPPNSPTVGGGGGGGAVVLCALTWYKSRAGTATAHSTTNVEIVSKRSVRDVMGTLLWLCDTHHRTGAIPSVHSGLPSSNMRATTPHLTWRLDKPCVVMTGTKWEPPRAIFGFCYCIDATVKADGQIKFTWCYKDCSNTFVP